jgi:hypothetical protein
VAQLGFYTNASRFHEIFIRQTANSVTRVIFPAFSSIQDEKEKFSSNYVKSFNMLALLMFLGSLVLIVSSRPLVSLALTEKWLPAVPFMQIFFVEGFFFPLMMFNQNILYSAILAARHSGLTLAERGYTGWDNSTIQLWNRGTYSRAGGIDPPGPVVYPVVSDQAPGY